MSDMTCEQITKALDAGIITEDQAKAMRDRSAIKTSSEAAVIGNEDDMRFLRSFSAVSYTHLTLPTNREV